MRLLRAALTAAVVSAWFVTSPTVKADVGDIGVEGGSYTGAYADPTGEKPESKLWFNDDAWWGSLWDTASARYEIFHFDAAAETWTSTDVPLDARTKSRADILWDGNKLYVASHVFSESPATGYPANLYRFSFDAATDKYTLDAGWPQQINNYRSESLVIDKDSIGQLWATWVQGSKVYVNRTTSGDSTWGTPFELPVNGTAVDGDDISSVIAFGDSKIGIFWSNQTGSSFHFAVHDDSAADTTWNNSVGVYAGSGNADDHINLKSLQTDGSGRVFAVVKTSQTTGSSPSIVLLERSTSAVWTDHTIWTRGNHLTRPIVLIDTSNSRIHAFAAEEGGGPVYTKTSPLSSITFAPGLGTTVMLDASATDINNPTSTKQNVSNATGLLVLASNQSTERYWHHFDPLGSLPTDHTFVPTDDTYVDSSDTTHVYGRASTLRVRASATRQLHTYLKFTVSGVGSVGGVGGVGSASLRLWVTDASVDGGDLFLVADSSWSEGSMNWSTKKPTSGTAIDTAGTVAADTWVELDVSSVVTGDGTYSFALINANSDAVFYSSSEASTTADQPQLVVNP